VPGFVNYKKGCTRLAVASDKIYHGLWFSRGTPASSTSKTGRHDIAEILAIVLSVLLRFTDSDCPYGIFKLFLPEIGGFDRSDILHRLL
jgi:hypothetical protein